MFSLWTRVHKSSKANECFERTAGCAPVLPNDTRWSFLYNSISCLLEISAAGNLDAIFDGLSFPKLTKQEIIFLQDYSVVLGPIAQALNKLQGDKKCSLGTNIYFG